MAKKEFSGRIKYLGHASFCQVFKAATVSVYAENGKVFVKSRLVVNPTRIFKCNEITEAEIIIKGQRLIIKSSHKHAFWELHFIGEGNNTNDKLLDEIHSMMKANSKIPENKAEVGCGRKSNSGINGRLFGVSPKTNQEPPQQGHAPSKTGQETPVSTRHKATSTLTSSPLWNNTPRSRTDDNSGSPCFTRVKENKRQSGETKRDRDDESKENQHRGPVNQNVDTQNKQGERKPLQVSSFCFYGASTRGKSSVDDVGSNNGFFKVTKSRPVSGPLFAPEGRKGQFSELMKTYSWNQNRKNTLAAAVKKETPQLQGFANIGNTCYMNAILQSLFGLDTFSMDLHSLCRVHSKDLTRQSLAVALTRLMVTKQRPQNNTAHRVEELLHAVKRAISSTAKRFIGSQQHDAHEFLCQVLDQLKEEVTRVSKPKEETVEEKGTPIPPGIPDFINNPVGASGDSLPASALSYEALASRTPPRPDQVFTTERPAICNGKTLSPEQFPALECAEKGSPPPSSLLISPTFNNFEFEVVHSFQCINCQEQIQKVEQFNDLSVDIPRIPGLGLSLQDALDIFFQKEEIEYRCEKCGHKKAEVTHKFAKLPRVLILHLKRYTYSQWNNKVQEKLLLPRYITLQDHCNTSTVPHLPYRITQISSPLKSPVLNSPVKQPTAVTPDYRQRRRRFSLDDNSACRGKKKVRRSLYADIHDEAPASDKKPRTALHELDLASKPTFAGKPKEELITIDLENDDADLQRAINLSLEEYEASQKDSDPAQRGKETSGSFGTNSNTPTWQQDSGAGSEGEGKLDVLKLSYEKQLELAIRRSLVPDENGPEIVEDSAHQNEHWNYHPQTVDSGAFKKPATVFGKTNTRKDYSQSVAESSESSFSAHAELMNQELGSGSVKSFTSASDFMSRSDLRQTDTGVDGPGQSDSRQTSANSGYDDVGLTDLKLSSPDSGDCDIVLTDLPPTSPDREECDNGVFTSCRRLSDTDKFTTPEASSTSVSTNIGSVGALSMMSPPGGKSEDDGGVENAAGQDLEFRRVKSHEGELYYTPQNSPDGKDSTDCAASGEEIVIGDTWSPEDEVQLADIFEEELTEFSDRWNLFNQASGKEGTEEKENMSPRAGMRVQNEVDSTEVPFDKEAEARQLQHKLRLTEIEKGILPHSYRLVSIVNHHGETSTFGHYVSDVFDIKKQTWFSFDDKNVERTTETFVRTKRTNTGYIFFYLSKDIFDDIENSRPGGNGKDENWPGGNGKELIERP